MILLDNELIILESRLLKYVKILQFLAKQHNLNRNLRKDS
jgi:hypothetical protein